MSCDDSMVDLYNNSTMELLKLIAFGQSYLSATLHGQSRLLTLTTFLGAQLCCEACLVSQFMFTGRFNLCFYCLHWETTAFGAFLAYVWKDIYRRIHSDITFYFDFIYSIRYLIFLLEFEV